MAEDIYAIDPAEVFTHVEVYDKAAYTTGTLSLRFPESYRVAKVTDKIYTLWRRQEWLESNEKLRLAKLSSTVRAAGKTARDVCEFIARDFASKILVGGDREMILRLTVGLVTRAGEADYDIPRFIEYLRNFNKQIVPDKDITAGYEEHIPSTNA